MKSFTFKLILVLVAVFGGAGLASAQSLAVTFTPDPLFSVSNALPGDAVMPYAELSQTSGSSQDIYVGATNVDDSDGLGSVVDLQITDHDTNDVLWSGTFADLFSSGQHFLLNLPDSTNKQLDFDANFQSSAGNEYQNATMLFDIWLGFDGGNDDGGGNPGGGGGGSGGGGTGTSGLTFFIFNENLDSINQSGPDSYDVTISWDSNLPGTTKLVYGPDNGSPYTLDLNDLNFGYPNGTTETDLGGVVDHTVLLPGLAPGTYRYRVVSYYGGQPTTSDEFQFTVGGGITPQVLGVTFGPGSGGGTPTPELFGQPEVLGETVEPDGPQPELINELVVEEGEMPLVPKDTKCLRTWILIVLGVILLTRLVDLFRNSDGMTKPQVLARRLITSIILALVALVILLIVAYTCPMPYVAIFMGLMIIWWGINRGRE